MTNYFLYCLDYFIKTILYTIYGGVIFKLIFIKINLDTVFNSFISWI